MRDPRATRYWAAGLELTQTRNALPHRQALDRLMLLQESVEAPIHYLRHLSQRQFA